MANFYIIDQSLCDNGSHHLDYVDSIANAAQAEGFRVTVGANRSFRNQTSLGDSTLPEMVTILPAFRQTTYQGESDLAGLVQMKRQAQSVDRATLLARLVSRFQQKKRQWRRRVLIQQFTADCFRFFAGKTLGDQDHVFFTTINELEFMGLALYLAKNPATVLPQWHLQFHFNLLHGRPPEYDRQLDRILAVRDSMITGLSNLGYHNLSFYTTSRELADQYQRLGVCHFENLPYPIAKDFDPARNHNTGSARPTIRLSRLIASDSGFNRATSIEQAPMFRPGTWTSDKQRVPSQVSSNVPSQSLALYAPETAPLRVVCPGAIRREKGQQNYLQQLVDDIYDSCLLPEKVRLVIQRPVRKGLGKEKIELNSPGISHPADGNWVEYLPHPLSREDYVNLIRTSDIGLLFYDSRIYYSRRAGVLGELLAAGKPVIVPAGCWLAEQISEPMFRHIESQLVQYPHQTLNLADFAWESQNVPAAGGRLAFDDQKHPFRFGFEITDDSSFAVLAFDWHWPQEKGVYCRVEVEQWNGEDQLLKTDHQIVGHRSVAKMGSARGNVKVLFNLVPEAKRVRFILNNAFHNSTASIQNVTVALATGSRQSPLPISSVGVIAADQSQLGNCLTEILTHHQHYQNTANAHAKTWYWEHDPLRTVRRLTAIEQFAFDVA
jgi:hypothetical protein